MQYYVFSSIKWQEFVTCWVVNFKANISCSLCLKAEIIDSNRCGIRNLFLLHFLQKNFGTKRKNILGKDLNSVANKLLNLFNYILHVHNKKYFMDEKISKNNLNQYYHVNNYIKITCDIEY